MACEVNNSRLLCCGTIASVSQPGHLRVGKSDIGELECNGICDGVFTGHYFPTRVTGKGVQGERFIEYVGQFQYGVLRV
jgi:hypothetical protein